MKMSSSLFSSSMMATEKMAGPSGTESSEKNSPYLQSRETQTHRKKDHAENTQKHHEQVIPSVIQRTGLMNTNFHHLEL